MNAMRTRAVQARYWVYRLFDKQGRLLYVGKTSGGMHRRLLKHQRDGEPWFARVDLTRTLCTPCESRAAMDAEWVRRQTLKRRPIVNRHRPGIDKPLAGAGPRPFQDPSVPLERTGDAPAPEGPSNADRRAAELRQAERELGMPTGSAFWNAKGEIDWHPGAFD